MFCLRKEQENEENIKDVNVKINVKFRIFRFDFRDSRIHFNNKNKSFKQIYFFPSFAVEWRTLKSTKVCVPKNFSYYSNRRTRAWRENLSRRNRAGGFGLSKSIDEKVRCASKYNPIRSGFPSGLNPWPIDRRHFQRKPAHPFGLPFPSVPARLGRKTQSQRVDGAIRVNQIKCIGHFILYRRVGWTRCRFPILWTRREAARGFDLARAFNTHLSALISHIQIVRNIGPLYKCWIYMILLNIKKILNKKRQCKMWHFYYC